MQKILVIDDEKPTLMMFRLTLAELGYEVFTAENGLEGVAVFDRERPPVVLTDIKMPGMNGIEVLERIKAIDPSAQVVVITGHGDMDLAIQALNLDAADFINKPVQRELLEQALARATERHARLGRSDESVSVERDHGAAVIVITGMVGAASEERLQAALQEALAFSEQKLVLRFAENANVNGAGIAVLTQVILEARRQGRHVALTGMSASLRSVFEMVGLGGMDVFESSGGAGGGR
jgi:YesN/AraC family two-component response regulator